MNLKTQEIKGSKKGQDLKPAGKDFDAVQDTSLSATLSKGLLLGGMSL